jgi:hypothetical protein
LDNDFISINKTRILNGAPDKYGFCAYNLESAKVLVSWFCITKVVNGVYPIWVNQFDLWPPKIKSEFERYYYALCFAFALSENRCVVTKFEKDNPVAGAPEIFIDNPLCPINPESFWSTTLDSEIIKKPILAFELVQLIKKLYGIWNSKYCKSNKVENVGLEKEPYFKYFSYPNFVTPYSGLIQIKKFSEISRADELDKLFKEITAKTKEVKTEIYNLLVNEFKYFD